jgi:homoserine/homoserine lactone efflux protein
MNPLVFVYYFATWLIFASIPGPAVIYSMAQARRHGFRSTLVSISGIELANCLFFLCFFLGLDSIFTTFKNAFAILRFIGAVYLFYLGVRLIHSTFRRPVPGNVHYATLGPEATNLFAQGLLVQLTNPKALIFVSALLPQFIDPHRSLPLQIIILLITTVTVDSVVLTSYAFLAQRNMRSLTAARWSAWLEWFFGFILILFGIRMLFPLS